MAFFRPGDQVVVLPSGFSSTIKTLERNGTDIAEAFAPMSIAMTLTDDIDISRGDMIVRENNQPEATQDFDAMICWLDSGSGKTAGQIQHFALWQRAKSND